MQRDPNLVTDFLNSVLRHEFLADSSEGNRVFTSFDYLAFYTCICQSGHQVTTY
jgi:hypothetical protein